MGSNDALHSRENSSEDETGSDEDKDDIVSWKSWCQSIKLSPLPTDQISVQSYVKPMSLIVLYLCLDFRRILKKVSKPTFSDPTHKNVLKTEDQL